MSSPDRARDAIDLVAAEPEAAKVVDVSFDDAGRMWAVTAVEYPLDANETPGAAEIYAKGGRDRVLVFDAIDFGDPPGTLRVLRKRLADAQQVPPFVVFSDATLVEMAARRPATSEEMAQISGVGSHKLGRYGSDFLQAIRDFGGSTFSADHHA